MLVSAIVAAAVLAVGQQADPYDFEVNVDYKPDLSAGSPPSCVPDPAGGAVCSGSFTDNQTGKTLTGSARRIGTGQEGPFRTTCDWSFAIRFVIHSTSMAVGEFRELSGGGGQSCSWAVQLADGTVAGDMRGNGTISLAGPLTAQFSMTMTVNVVGGTGAYAGFVGSGTYTHSQTVQLSSGARALAAAAPTSMLDLTLSKGKPKARLWAGRGALRVVTVPGSSCRITARKGAALARKTVRDGDRDGLLSLRLARGRWAVVAACTYATGRAVVTVS